MASFNDGGTKMVKVVDVKGQHFDIYLDNRGCVDGPIYIDGYPGDKGSILIRDQSTFKSKVMTSLGENYTILKNSGP
jgi:hypothetical protein